MSDDPAPLLDLSVDRIVACAVPIATGFIAVGAIAKTRVLARPTGHEKPKAFLHKENFFLAGFVLLTVVVVAAARTAGVVDDLWWQSGLGFLLGASLSAACGWSGMLIAAKANVRTTEAARTSLNEGLKKAFSSGAVMDLSVVSVGLFGVALFYGLVGGSNGRETAYLAGLGFGASSIALFARVGAGIYMKAADVGADLVGKVEASIPESPSTTRGIRRRLPTTSATMSVTRPVWAPICSSRLLVRILLRFSLQTVLDDRTAFSPKKKSTIAWRSPVGGWLRSPLLDRRCLLGAHLRREGETGSLLDGIHHLHRRCMLETPTLSRSRQTPPSTTQLLGLRYHVAV